MQELYRGSIYPPFPCYVVYIAVPPVYQKFPKPVRIAEPAVPLLPRPIPSMMF